MQKKIFLLHPFPDAEGITYRKTVRGPEKKIQETEVRIMPDNIKGLGKKIDEFILNNGKIEDPENDILKIDDIENDGIAEDVAKLRKALDRFKDTSGDLYMEIVNITGSAKDDFNIIGANAFCDNAERNIVNKAQGKYVDHSDISEKNEKGFETFLETVVRKDDKGKTGFSDLMDQAMAKAFRKEPLPEDPVEATKERRSRLKAMDDSAKVIDRAGEFVGSVSDISRITKTDMTNEVSSMKRSVEHQKKKLRAEKIGMLDDVVDRMSHSKRWRSNNVLIPHCLAKIRKKSAWTKAA